MLKFDDDAFRQMRKVEDHVGTVLRPYRESTEAGLVAFALIRTARVLLRLYPQQTQRELVEVCCRFLKDESTEDRIILPN
jgi:hypothetical protein